MFSSAILIFILTTATASPFPKVRSGLSGAKTKRSSDSIIKDCFHVASTEGHYYYRSTSNDPTVCGFYVVADPSQVVEIFFDYLDVPCNTGGLVAVVDGWELNGGYFPTVSEHPLPLEQRVSEFCGLTAPSKVFITSQNAALIQYRVPKQSKGFSFKVNFLKNPSPCNMLIDGLEDLYTVRQTGKASNCSLMALYPVHASILSLNVGETVPGFNKKETGTMRRCQESGLKDYVEISGGYDLVTPKQKQAETFCGVDTYPRPTEETVLCGISTIKLVSSGEYDNILVVKIRQAGEQDLLSPTIICD
ncbi:corticotropin-releasing factor-binding protein [Cimex lectularius]|uniref:Corticotropin-releasing factor-binding protein n=1 Tax=Cimex lectularius TaxID=79782 RepID=A0A8I6S0E5_CIMLE|nr:corticotropin-releasing factor-binding protein [Cimex lectularius]